MNAVRMAQKMKKGITQGFFSFLAFIFFQSIIIGLSFIFHLIKRKLRANISAIENAIDAKKHKNGKIQDV
jgi:hypothetical protein